MSLDYGHSHDSLGLGFRLAQPWLSGLMVLWGMKKQMKDPSFSPLSLTLPFKQISKSLGKKADIIKEIRKILASSNLKPKTNKRQTVDYHKV